MEFSINRILFFLNVAFLVASWPDFLFFPRDVGSNYKSKSNTSLNDEPFDWEIPTFFIVHGFNDYSTDEKFVSIKNLLNRYERVNVIMVDWKEGASKQLPLDLVAYEKAVKNTHVVSKAMIEYIKSNEIDPKLITCLGHSLGAHICGFVAKSVRDMARIIAIDPAGPSFRGTKPLHRLDANDALQVECIHTSALVGIVDPICKVNFYVNGLTEQPLCFFLDASCAHYAGLVYFAESIRKGNKCKFLAAKCDQGKWILNQCDKCLKKASCIEMGYHTSKYKNASGSYYIRTKKDSPYCLN